MKCFGQGLRQTVPVPISSAMELAVSKPPKVNGWCWPPKAHQVLCWLGVGFLAVVGFGIYIPLLPPPWIYAAYSLTGIHFVIHIVTHIATVTLDPAHAVARRKYNFYQPKPAFDRTKQAHVIQNLHCNVCDIEVGPKVKHCRLCNKCVDNFDHHCIWLNNCVGGRNYWYFFASLLSALLGVVLLLATILFVFIQHYLDPSSLRTAPQFNVSLDNATWLMFLPLAPVQSTANSLQVLAFISSMVCLCCLLLFGHLLSFHLYLFYKGLSTYEYIKMKRERESRDSESANTQNSRRSMDCKPVLPRSPSACKAVGNKSKLTSVLSDSICTMMKKKKKPLNNGSGLHNDTDIPAVIAVNDTTSYKHEGEESQNTERVASVKFAENIHGVQTNLGSPTMSPDHTPD